MAKENATDKEMEDVLRVAAADFVFDLPQGIDTSLQEFGQGFIRRSSTTYRSCPFIITRWEYFAFR